MNYPFFSVIIPNYKRTDLLTRALDSVHQQLLPKNSHFKNSSDFYECLVIDDGSPNYSSTQFKKFNELSNFNFHHEPVNRGVSYARNKGIAQAKGEWLAFLDSDDEWQPKKLLKCFEYINQHSQNKSEKQYDDFKIFQTNDTWVRNGKVVNPPLKYQKTSGDLFKDSLENCCITVSSVVIHHDLFSNPKLRFKKALPACEDYDLWIKISDKFPIYLLPEKLTTRYQGHSDQLSFRYPVMDFFRIKAIENYLHDKHSVGQKYLTSVDREKIAQAKKIYLNKWRILFNGSWKRKRFIFILQLIYHYLRFKINFSKS